MPPPSQQHSVSTDMTPPARAPKESLGAMLFMESWPAPTIDAPEDSTLGRPAPHVVACAHATVVMDLQRPDVDMVVWGRRIPATWEGTFTNCSQVPSALTLAGTPSEIADSLANPALHQDWSPLILTDVRDLSALFGALTGGVRQHIQLITPSRGETAFELPPDALRLICAYGGAGPEWCGSQNPKSGIVSTLTPFAVAFIKGAAEGKPGCLHRLPENVTNDARPGPILVMDTVPR